MVAFLAGRLRCLAVAEFQPRQHGFADMDTAVVDDIGLHHFPTVCLLNLSDRIAQQVVAHMPEVKRFVGVRRRVLHHHQGGAYPFPLPKRKGFFRRPLKVAVLIVGIDGLELVDPERVGDREIKKSLYRVVFGYQFFAVSH